MGSQVMIVTSTGNHGSLNSVVLADLLIAYHLQTEAEKGTPVAGVAELPRRYRREVEDPRGAFHGQTVFVAMIGSQAVGCVVMTSPLDGRCEVKRLWTDPASRGRGVATRLIEATLIQAAEIGVATVQLTVWQWRAAAVALYERLGFVRSESWEEREGLVCMQRRLGRGDGC